MKLERETVKEAIRDFSKVHGWPRHIETDTDKRDLIDIMHRELSRLYSEEQFDAACATAWQQARRFPIIADFYRGFDAPEATDYGPIIERIIK